MKLTINHAQQCYINWPAARRVYLLTVTLLVGMLLLFGYQTWQGRRQLGELGERIAALRQENAAMPATQTDLPSIDQHRLRLELDRAQELLDRDAFHWTKLFDRLEQLLPPHVSLSGFTPDYRQRSLAIQGVAQELVDLRQLLDNLFRSGQFSQVYLREQSEEESTDPSGRKHKALHFSIELEGVF